MESWGLILEIGEWVMGQKGHGFVEPEVPPSNVVETTSPSVLYGSPSGTKVPQVVKVERKSEGEDAEGQQSVDAADHEERAHHERHPVVDHVDPLRGSARLTTRFTK